MAGDGGNGGSDEAVVYVSGVVERGRGDVDVFSGCMLLVRGRASG